MNGKGNAATTVWLFHCHRISRLENAWAYQNSSVP